MRERMIQRNRIADEHPKLLVMMKKILLGLFLLYGSICIQAEDKIQPDGSVEGPEIRKALHSLDCSAQYFVEVIAGWAESVFAKPGEKAFTSFSYAFYHSAPDIGEITAAEAALNESSIQCAGIPRLSCASLINNEASVGAKGLGEYLVGLLSDINDSEDLLRQTTAFGWSPSHGFMNETMDAPTFDPEKADHARIEGGGGSGAGFQLFCDDVLLLSAGGGGGGGVEGQLIHDGNDYSIGGGGGGGTQFRLPERHGGFKRMGDWVSIGGGGGCGTHDQQDEDGRGEHVTGLLCGRQMDADSSDDGRQNMLLNETLTWCRSKRYTIRLAGGGGGGGGTAECCKGYQIGYGFSFQLIAQPPSLPPSPPSLPTPPPAPKIKSSKTSHGHHHKKKQSDGKSKAHRYHHSHHKYLRLDQEMKNVLENGEDKSLPLAAPVAALASAGQQQERGAVPQSIEESEKGAEEMPLLAAPAGVVPEPPEGGAIPQDAIDAQLKYDPLFAYLYNASKTCEGGFQDWCCVCKDAKRLLRNSTDERFIWFKDVTCCRDDEKEEQATDDGALNGKKPNDDWHASATTHTWRPEDDTPIFKPPAPPSQCHLVLQGGRVTLVPWGQEEEEAESSSSFQSSSSLLEQADEEAAIITLPRLEKSKSSRSSPIEFEKAARPSLGGGGESAPFPGTWWGMLLVITAAFMYLIRGSGVAASLGRRSIPSNIFLRMRRKSVRGQEGEGEEEEAVDERSSMMVLMRSYQSRAAARRNGDDEKEEENRLHNSADSRIVGYGTI